jgi:hypothetical protein
MTDVIDAVLLITVPGVIPELTRAPIVAVNEAPTAREFTVTVGLLPDPPQVPAVVAQFTNES